MRFIPETEAGALRAHLDKKLEGHGYVRPSAEASLRRAGASCLTSARRPLTSARMGIRLSF